MGSYGPNLGKCHDPLQHSRPVGAPTLSKIYPDICFSGFDQGGPKIVKNLKTKTQNSFFLLSACAPLCCKNMCCASRFCTGGGGAAGSRSKQCPRVHKAKMLAQGNNLRLREQGGSQGRSRTHDKKTRTVSTFWSNPGGISLILKDKTREFLTDTIAAKIITKKLFTKKMF